MKIQRITAYRVELPLHEGSYKWSGGKSVSVFDCTVVEVITDAGITGWGEVCPLGPFYLPAYGPGARTGIAELAPHLLGLDPRDLGSLNRRMDAALKGHPYVKSALDMACWAASCSAAGRARRSISTAPSRRKPLPPWPPGSPATARRATGSSSSRWE